MPIESDKRFTLHAIIGVALRTDIDGSACIQDALIQDGDDSGTIVHTVIGAFCQRHTSSCDHHRTLRDIHGAQLNFVIFRSLILARYDIFVFLGNLLGHSFCRIIQLLEHIFTTDGIIPDNAPQVLAKRFCHREIDTAVGCVDGVAINIVKIAVRVSLVVVVQAIEANERQNFLVFQRWLRKI